MVNKQLLVAVVVIQVCETVLVSYVWACGDNEGSLHPRLCMAIDILITVRDIVSTDTQIFVSD